MFNLIERLTDPQFMATAVAAIAAFATIVTIGLPWLERDRLANRMKAVSTEREALRRKQREAMQANDSKKQLRTQSSGFMKDVVDQLNLEKLLESDGIRDKLAMAGYRGQGPYVTFLFFRFAMPIVILVAAIIYFFAINDLGLPVVARIAFSVLAGLAGFYLPNMFVQNMVQRRQDAVQRAFPDSLDLLLICVESGMSIEASFNKVAEEIGNQSVEMAEELGLTTAELSYLPERRQAYENLAKRTGLPGVKAVSTSLMQAERYGTPLGQALRVMAQENRDMRMANAEKKAAALPPKLTVPMIVFFLPVLFVVILGPAVIRYLNS